MEQLEYLVEISRTNSMALAGKNLYISHQGISKAIASLERELGVKLVNRTPTGVFLTGYGEKYVKWATPVLEGLKTLKAETLSPEINGTSSFTETLSIYTAPLFTISILPETILKFRAHHPGIKLSTQKMDSNEILAAVAAKKTDLGLITLINNNLRNSIEQMNATNKVKLGKLFFSKLLILTNKASPIAYKKSITIKELLHYPLSFTYELRNIIDYLEAYDKLYEKPQISLVSPDIKTTLGATSQGETNFFMSEYSYRNAEAILPHNVVAIPISDNIKYFVGWVTNRDSKPTNTTQLFIDILKTII
jgi:Transcriptional regulator